MILATIFEYIQGFDTPLLIEYYFKGERIEDPIQYFESNKSIYDLVFPSPEETMSAINKYIIFRETHKLVISEYGFHLVHR